MTREERQLLQALRAHPRQDEPRLVYIDWLEERGEPRADVLRLLPAFDHMDPDDPRWHSAEKRLSIAAHAAEPEWLAGLGCPLRRYPLWRQHCVATPVAHFHREIQDTTATGWKRLCDTLERARVLKPTTLDPFEDLSDEERDQIVTLPPTIRELQSVEVLRLYRSPLVRIPEEIAEL